MNEENQVEEELNLKSLKSISVIAGILGHPFDLGKTMHEFSIGETPNQMTLIRILKKSGFKTKKKHNYKKKKRSTRSHYQL